MAGAAIALALIVVIIFSIPWPLWMSRIAASFRRRRRTDAAMTSVAPSHGLRPGLRRLVDAGRRARLLIEALGPVAADYRKTLPYLNLFFADVRTSLDVKNARWVVLTRQDYELAVSDVAKLLVQWQAAADELNEPELLAVDSIGGCPTSVEALLEDGTRLPRTPIDAQRLRFCEAWEVERLEESLTRVAADLFRFEQSLLDAHVGPYR